MALIEQNGPWLIARGQRSQVRSWLDALPADLRRERPRLGHLYAVILIQTNQTATGEAVLTEVERGLASIASGDERRTLWGQVLLSGAVLSWYTGDQAAELRFSEMALELLQETPGMSRTVATIYAASAYRLTGDVSPACERRMREAVVLGRDLAHDIGPVSPYAVPMIGLGRLHQAAACFEQAQDLLGTPIERRSGHSAIADIARAELLLEHNDLGKAEDLVRQGLELMDGPTTAGAENLLSGALVLARLLQARGNWRGAFATLDAFDELARQRGFVPGILALLAAGRARLSLAQGDLVAAEQWAECTGLTVNDEISFSRESEYLTLARVLITQNPIEPALRPLDRRLLAAEADERWGSAIGIRVLLALAHQASGDRSAAMIHLDRALRLAAPEGYIRIFVDEGPAMLRLLREAQERRILSDYVGCLLIVFAGERDRRDVGDETMTPAAQPTGLRSAPPTDLLAESISEREIEVLRLIAAGYSNQEIADTLVIALGTVKKHINNLYGKLAVSSRTQALLRARALDLL